MSTETAPAPVKRSRLGLIIFTFLALAAVGGGAAVPWFLNKHDTHEPAPKKTGTPAHKPTAIPFGDVVVNLGEERLTRYLRAKLLVVIDESESREMTELLGKQKVFLKSWLIGYLSDQTVKEVSRAAGVNRIRREVRDQFNAMLFNDGSEKILDILFDEFVVQ